MAKSRCQGFAKSSGTDCTRWAIYGEDFCGLHKPKKHDFNASEIDSEIEERTAEIQKMLVEIESVEDIHRFLLMVISDTYRRVIDAPTANALKSLLTLLREILEKDKKPEQNEKERQAQIVIMAENLTINEAFALLQDPAKAFSKLHQEVITIEANAPVPNVALIQDFKKSATDILFKKGKKDAKMPQNLPGSVSQSLSEDNI